MGHARHTRYAGEDGSLAGGRVRRAYPLTPLQVRPPEAPPRRPPHPAAANAFICGLRASCWRALALPWRLRLSTSRSLAVAAVGPSCRSGAEIRAAESPVATRAPLRSSDSGSDSSDYRGRRRVAAEPEAAAAWTSRKALRNWCVVAAVPASSERRPALLLPITTWRGPVHAAAASGSARTRRPGSRGRLQS